VLRFAQEEGLEKEFRDGTAANPWWLPWVPCALNIWMNTACLWTSNPEARCHQGASNGRPARAALWRRAATNASTNSSFGAPVFLNSQRLALNGAQRIDDLEHFAPRSRIFNAALRAPDFCPSGPGLFWGRGRSGGFLGEALGSSFPGELPFG